MTERPDGLVGPDPTPSGVRPPDVAHVRAAIQMLLDRPGGLRPDERAAAEAAIAPKTAEVGQAVNTILLQRARMMLHRALRYYIGQKFQRVDERPPPTIHDRLDRALDAAIPAYAASGLIPYLEARECEVYWADKELDNAMHCFRATFSDVADEAELPGMLGLSLSEAAGIVDEPFNRLIDGDDAGFTAALRTMATTPPAPEVEACLGKRRAIYERLLLEQGVLYAQDRRAREWEAAEQDPGESSTTDDDASKRFLKRLAESCRDQKPDTVTPFTTRHLREGRLVGRPEYDLPIARLQSRSPGEVAALADACANLAAVDGPDRAFFEDLARSLAALRDRDTDEYRYEADPFGVIVARFRRLQPPSNPRKWIDVLEAATARPEAAEAILDTLGYLPEAMFRDARDPSNVNQTFGRKLGFDRIIRLYDAIEEMLKRPRDAKPTGGVLFNDFELLDAQGVLLENLLFSERLEKLAVSASVDIQGLYLTLQQRGSGGGEATLSFHLPFRHVSDPICARLRAMGALSDSDVLELQQERAGVQHDREQVADIDRRKEQILALRLHVTPGQIGEELSRRLLDPSQHDGLVQALQPNMDEITRLPQSAAARVIVEALYNPSSDALPQATGALVRYASVIQRRCSRKKGLSDPRNYEAMRSIIMPMLRALDTDYRRKKKCGLRHCFVERPRRRQLLALWPEGDDSAAVLIDLDKFPGDHFGLATEYTQGGPSRNLVEFGPGPWGS